MKSGGKELALRLEDEGYGPILREAGLAPTCPTRRCSSRRAPPSTTTSASPSRRRVDDGRPMAIQTTRAADDVQTTKLDAERDPARLPDPPAGDQRPPLVYLDSASSSQKPQVVIDAIDTYYREYNANVHRGIYTIGEKATAEYEKARAKVARFINAPDAHEVVFTRNATEAINLVAYSWGRKNIARGDAIVLTEMEHHANLVPWQLLVQEKDGDLEFIPITDDGLLRLDVFEVLLRLQPKLVAFTHVSNTLGTINPVREMVEMAHAAGALVLVDGAQAVPHVPVDVQDLGADFYAFSGHKMLAPDGLRRAVGPARAARGDAAVPRRRRDDPRGPPPPLRVERHPVEVRGGDAGGRRRDRAGRRGGLPRATWAWTRSASTSASSSTYALDVAAGAGARRSSSTARSTPTLRGGVVPFNLPGIHPHDVAQVLDRFGIAVRAGHHCTMPLHERLDLAATARASFNVYSTRDDIDALADGLGQVQKVFAA